MHSTWPLAYADGNVSEPLLDHLIRTACLARCLFEDRALTLLRRWGRAWDPGYVLWLLGFLHDIGKASDGYRSSGTGKLGFPLHEYVSALIVYYCGDAVSEREVDLGDLMKVLAKSIARHHAAMVDRDAVTVITAIENSLLTSEENYVKRISYYLSKVDESTLRSLLVEGLKDMPYSTLITESVLKALEKLKGSRQSFFEQALRKLKAGRDSWVVGGLTGFLVLADNVAANAFRRVSDDGFTPLYISIWTRELGDRLNRCSTCLQGTVTGRG